MFTFAALFIFSLVTFVPPGLAHAAQDPEPWVAKAREMRLHERTEWLRLVHYRKKRGSYQSEADNAAFFAAADGKTNPENEMVETLRAFFKTAKRPMGLPGVDDMSAQCQYPARLKWFIRELQMPSEALPKETCQQLEDFRGKVRARSATLIFSGYFVNNPSTVFGHVLLRLNRDEAGRGSELLDMGVNYAANMTTSNPILYAVMGMTGMFRGTFTAIPYYYKVREYSDAESRDLWEYDLDLKLDEIEILVDHLWEMGSTFFDYYYFDENCAYHLLALLEAAAPRLNLVDRVPFYVIPVDSVKAVTEEPGLVSRVRYRPSTQRQLTERFETLSPRERALFLRVRDADKPAEVVIAQTGLTPEEAAHVLDAVLDHIDYRFFRELVLKTDPAAAARKQNVLITRAKLPVTGEVKVPFSDRDRPDRSHASGRWWIAGGTRDADTGQAGAVDAEVRYALHGLMDPHDGYLPNSVVEFWRMQGRFIPSTSRAELHSFSLFTVSSLSPLTRLESPLAWRIEVGAHRVRDRRCENCLSAMTHAMLGYSLAPSSGTMAYALVGPFAETSDGFAQEKWLASLGARIGGRWRPARGWAFGIEGEGRRVYDRETFDRLTGRALLRWDLERAGNHWFSLELDHALEVSRADTFLKFIRYF